MRCESPAELSPGLPDPVDPTLVALESRLRKVFHLDRTLLNNQN